jgi:large subunit ribosomal protein L29
MTKARDLRELSVADLKKRDADLNDQLFRMRIQKAMGHLDVPLKLRTTRRDLARVKTVLRDKLGRARRAAGGRGGPDQTAGPDKSSGATRTPEA